RQCDRQSQCRLSECQTVRKLRPCDPPQEGQVSASYIAVCREPIPLVRKKRAEEPLLKSDSSVPPTSKVRLGSLATIGRELIECPSWVRFGLHGQVRCTAAFPSKPGIALGSWDVALGPILGIRAVAIDTDRGG